MTIAMYGMTPMQPGIDPDEWQRQLDELRRTATLPSFTFTPSPLFATKADLDEAVRRIEVQMFALLEQIKKATHYATETERLRWTEALVALGLHARDNETPEQAVTRLAKRLRRPLPKRGAR